MMQARVCDCGATFVPSAPRVRFCSMACARHFGRPSREATCRKCSAVFETRTPIQIYCSVRCRRDARRARIVKTCQECSADYHSLDSRQRFCSRRCARLGARWKRGARAYNWKGGRAKTSGYVRARAPDHPRATKGYPYVLEHILVMEKILGRYLLPNERVHHRNGKRDDNRRENLELWKMKDPPGVRAADYHCAGCTCNGRIAADEAEATAKDKFPEAAGKPAA